MITEKASAPLFIGTKVVHATPMTRLEYNNYRDWALPPDENGEDAGFLVEYVDGGKPNHPDHHGYISWSPADVFTRAYRPASAMGFGEAITALKAGQRVARAGWNGKGMFAYLVPANRYAATTPTGHAIAQHHADGLVPYRTYLALKTVDEDVATWVPSCSDVLAEDWELVG